MLENVYNIRKEKNLYFILPESVRNENNVPFHKTAVISYLYYSDTVESYIKYLKNIPNEIDMYIVSSDKGILEIVAMYLREREKVFFIEKQNRGRDVSALLVACKEIVLKYEYICFIHDKKEKRVCEKKDVKFWIENLWDNTLKSTNYVYNILNVFKENPNIGLLVPPEPLGEYFTAWFGNAWAGNFEKTKMLVEKMNLCCNLDKKFPPITIGTVLWAKVEAIQKLFGLDWNYEDFDEEPLAIDGTISHAIERVFAYVAQDAGYNTGTVMATCYAEKKMNYLQQVSREAYTLLHNELHIRDVADLRVYENKKNEILRFVENNKRIYVYGAGKTGKDCLAFLKRLGKLPTGFVVTKLLGQEQAIEGVNIYELQDLVNVKDVGIIIAVGEKYKEDVVLALGEKGIYNYIEFLESRE